MSTLTPVAGPAWEKWGGTKGVSGTTPFWTTLFFPYLKHFISEETPPVPPKFSHQVCKNLEDQLSEKVGAASPPPPPVIDTNKYHRTYKTLAMSDDKILLRNPDGESEEGK